MKHVTDLFDRAEWTWEAAKDGIVAPRCKTGSRMAREARPPWAG
jgi:hypothetical protein